MQDEQKYDINKSKHDSDDHSAGCFDIVCIACAVAANLQSDDEIDIQFAAHAEATPPICTFTAIYNCAISNAVL